MSSRQETTLKVEKLNKTFLSIVSRPPSLQFEELPVKSTSGSETFEIDNSQDNNVEKGKCCDVVQRAFHFVFPPRGIVATYLCLMLSVLAIFLVSR